MPTVGEAFQQARELTAAGQLHEAEAIYRQLAALLPQAPEVWGQMGIFFLEAERPDAAIEPLVKAIELSPDASAYHGALGAANRLLKRHEQAIASFSRALEIGPPTPGLYNNVALALKDARRYDEALASIDAALAMDPAFQKGYYNRGNLLLAMRRVDEAIASLRRALELDPTDAGAHCTLGLLYFDRADFDRAMVEFDRALALRPNYVEVHRNKAIVQLLRGEYEQAWRSFEARLECADFPKLGYQQPRWDGSPLAGRTLYVYAEQGLGDSIQFVRYLPLAAQSAGRVYFAAHEVLRPLLVQAGFGEYLTSGEKPPEFDVHVSLMSLAGYLPDRSGQPYWPGKYLKVDAGLVEQWARRLKDVRGFRIGIAWAGNPDHSYDQYRSTRLASFAPLADIPGVQLISLQKGAGREQLAELAGRANVLDLDDEMDHEHGAFVDRAAVIENLDLVISVDTAVVHLAGALGKPAWVALQHVPDWRWRMEGETTPWYPSLRLFRQCSFDDWAPVFERIRRGVARAAAEHVGRGD